MRPRQPSGFTIVELLVVISIIGVLVALLMPAISSSRERSRQSQCASHLRQIGQAIYEYLNTHRAVPVSVSPWSEGPQPAAERSGKGWIVSILPHFEHTNLMKDLVLTGDFYSTGVGPRGLQDPDSENRAALMFNVELLKCPNDGENMDLITDPPDFTVSGIQVATTNYKGVAGDPQIAGSLFPGSKDCHDTSPCNGVFFRNSYQFPKRWDRFPDGTSNTLIVGEDVPRYNRRSAWCFANGDWASCHIPLNYKPDPPAPLDFPHAMGFRSNHPDGVLFLLGDGQVRFLHDNIDHNVYRALGTRDNHKNEPLITEFPQ
jgi:prepilin-type N-terminal cleavage/methylation domain-containing protein